jgi:hypothetical protein
MIMSDQEYKAAIHEFHQLGGLELNEPDCPELKARYNLLIDQIDEYEIYLDTLYQP